MQYLLFFSFFLTLAFLGALIVFTPSTANAYERKLQKTAIVLAAFGTTDPEALKSILNVEKKVIEAFPDYDVHLAFTSNMIRDKWKKLALDENFRKENPNISERIYEIKNPLTILALIQEEGSRDILVQSLHITNGSEYGDLKSIIDNLAKISALQESLVPFPKLLFSDSALSEGNKEDIERAIKAMAPLARAAKDKNATLVLMGHGNEHLPLPIYTKIEKALSEEYQLPVFIALVEGSPSFKEVIEVMAKNNIKEVYLAPLMLVAGDHAKNDMASEEEGSLASLLKEKGYKVNIHLQGLGSLNAWADIYVEKLKLLANKK